MFLPKKTVINKRQKLEYPLPLPSRKKKQYEDAIVLSNLFINT